VPKTLEDMQENGDEEQRARVAEAKSRMGKLDIKKLEEAFSEN